MIKFNQIFRAAVVSLTIGMAALGAGQASAYTYNQGQLLAAAQALADAASNVADKYAMVELTYNSMTGLAEEYRLLQESCHNPALSGNQQAMCILDAYDWWANEEGTRTTNYVIANEDYNVAWSDYMDAFNTYNGIAADCCEP